MLGIAEIFTAVQVAVFAAVLHHLIQPDMIFGFWGRMLARRQWSWPSWIRNPLGECLTCFSGQIGLWSGVALEAYQRSAHVVIFEPVLPPVVHAVLRVVLHTVLVIYLSGLLTKWSK